MELLRHFEYGLSPAAFLLLFLYHVYLAKKIRRDPMSTSQGLAHRTRDLWVRDVIACGRDILAVQTLRNWTMGATFLASTAILISLGIFNLAITSDRQGELSQILSHFGSMHPGLWLGKLMLLGGDFLFAFFNFLLAIRYYNHTGFMINLPKDSNSEISVEDVIAILDRGGLHYFLGMRGYYLAIPLLFWLFGPIWLLAGVFFIVAMLHYLDRGV